MGRGLSVDVNNQDITSLAKNYPRVFSIIQVLALKEKDSLANFETIEKKYNIKV